MALDDEDEEFTFCAPAEESEGLVAGDEGRISTDLVSKNLMKTTSLLLVQKSTKSRRFDGRNVPLENDGMKPRQVAALLQKLGAIDDDDEISALRYWRSLAYLCADSNSRPAFAFVQHGGIALSLRILHDFMANRGERGDRWLEIVTEIFRCFAAISASQTFVNFDVELIADTVGPFIDLTGWMLVKGTTKKMALLETPLKDYFGDLYRPDKKHWSKLPILLPGSRMESEATDFDVFTVQLPSENTLTDDAEMNPVTFTALHNDYEDRRAAVRTAIETSTEKSALRKYTSPPMVGSVCLMAEFVEKSKIDLSRNELCRGLVISHHYCEKEVSVFAIDYGFTTVVPWPSLYHLPEEAKQIKPATYIGFVRDAVPAPNLPAFEAALNVLFNLSSRKLLMHPLLKRDIVEALLLILRLRDQDAVVESAMKILTNLSIPYLEKRQQIVDSGGLEQLFLLGSELAESKNNCNNSDASLLQLVLQCMTNLLQFNDAARRKFTTMKGLLLPNYIVAQYSKDSTLYQMAMRLTTAAFSESVASEEWQQKQKSWTEKTLTAKTDCPQLTKLLMDSLKVQGGKVSFDALFTPEMLALCPPRQDPTTALKPTAEVEDILQRVSVPMTGDRYYFRSEKVNLAEGDRWSVVCDVTDLHQLKTRWVQELCCAALNSRHRLTIYFGLERDGRVQGLQVGQWERDEFRIGIDWSLSRAFRPFLEPTMYNVEFVPVFVGGTQPKAVPDLYVIELQIRHIATEAYQLDKDGAVYVRINDQVVQLSLQEAGEYFAHQLQDEKQNTLMRLRRQISVLKAMLGSAASGCAD